MRAVILGVGNRMRGDDAVGPCVVDALQGRTGALLFDCGTAPENFVGKVVRTRPERILIVDACACGGRPGQFRIFNRQEIDMLAAGLVSTHALPLGLTVALLEQELVTPCDEAALSADALLRADVGEEPCQSRILIELLGVQPARLDFGAELSPELQKALPEIVRAAVCWAEQD